ncbi:MAG: serine/threonine protein kinase [Chloroflexi bacterium]|nr:serine/threonine protein kinase [Chloroflexota bacterium]
MVIYRVLVLIGLAVFVAADVLLTLVLLGDDRLLLSIAISTLVAVITYTPVRRLIQHFIDRHLYHFRFDLNELHTAHKTLSHAGLLSEQTLGGYKLLELVGVGGVTEVYKAVGDNEVVAVKILRKGDEVKHHRFELEARTGMSLHHPNIAHVQEYTITGNLPYMVVEFIDGVDLSTVIKRGALFSHIQILRWIDDICRALDFAHAEGAIHSNIKPPNIIIRHDNSAVLTDFGMSKFAYHESDVTGAIYYMAPEQIRNKMVIDHRVDIYALSVVVYELLTLQRPFQGTMEQVLFAHLNDPPPDPHTINANISDDAACAVMRGMSKKPADRFSTAGDFALALQGYLPQPDND